MTPQQEIRLYGVLASLTGAASDIFWLSLMGLVVVALSGLLFREKSIGRRKKELS